MFSKVCLSMQWSEPNNWPCAFTSEIIISQNTVDTPATYHSLLFKLFHRFHNQVLTVTNAS